MPADPLSAAPGAAPCPAPNPARDRGPWLQPLGQRISGVPLGWLILFLLFANTMLAFPQIDQALAGLFYTEGIGFGARGAIWERALYGSVPVLMVVGNLALVALWAVNRWGGHRLLGLTGRKLLLLLCLLALLPGLLVNQVFKEHWGRARPEQVEAFGGDRPFTPAFVRAEGKGGSFSSGHVAAAAYLIAVAHLLRGPSSPWVAGAALYTGLIALARMAAGGHFLSDVVTSVFLVLLGYLALRHLLCPETDSACRPGPR